MKFISNFFKFIAGFVMGFVVLVLPLVLLLRSIGGIIFSQNEMVNLVESNVLNSEILASFAEATMADAQSNPNATFTEKLSLIGFKNFTHQDWVLFFDLIAPVEITTRTASELLTGFYQWIDDDSQVMPQFQIDITLWKGTLSTNAVPVMVMVMDRLPACSADQVLEYGLSGDLSVSNLPLCRPPEPLYSDLLNQFSVLVPSVLARYDDVLQAGGGTGFANNQTQEDMLYLKASLRSLRGVMRSGWVVVFMVYAVGIVMGARSLAELFRWGGNPLMLAGFLTLGGAILLLFLGGSIVTVLGRSLFREASQTALVVFDAVVGSTITQVARPLLLQGVVLILFGGAGVAVAAMVKNSQKKKAGEAMTSTVTPVVEDQMIIEFPQGEENDEDRPSGMFG